ncbi:MAG: DUF2752 domain-containing protein [Bacteroidales bacterium]|nr:DUF2752 domain-containing protein [Bacteroidales bacterium]
MLEHISLKDAFNWLWHRKEAILWLAALAWLAIDNPVHHQYTLCPFHNMGISFCPGCGLGRSIGFLFRLDFKSSFLAHPLGIPASILLVRRIIKVLFKRTNYNLSTI